MLRHYIVLIAKTAFLRYMRYISIDITISNPVQYNKKNIDICAALFYNSTRRGY